MLERIKQRHHVVAAYLALFVALGGSSYAAITVTGKNVRDGSLTGSDVKNSSLGTADVKNGSLLAGDFKGGQLPAGPRGPFGAAGPQGPRGGTGPQGATGPTFGFVAGGGTPPTLAERDLITAQESFNLPAAGRLYLEARISETVACALGALVRYGLYVDDVPVPGSGRQVHTTQDQEGIKYLQFAGVTGPLSAGAHRARLGFDCVDGNPSTYAQFNDAGFTGILLGG